MTRAWEKIELPVVLVAILLLLALGERIEDVFPHPLVHAAVAVVWLVVLVWAIVSWRNNNAGQPRDG